MGCSVAFKYIHHTTVLSLTFEKFKSGTETIILDSHPPTNHSSSGSDRIRIHNTDRRFRIHILVKLVTDANILCNKTLPYCYVS